MKERRQHTRMKASLEVTYSIIGQHLQSGSRSIDLSEGGIRLPVTRSFNPGMVLRMKINSPKTGKVISAEGEVIWIKRLPNPRFPFEIGIQFTNIAPSDRNILEPICRLEGKESTDIRWVD